ncbi:MAG: ParB N-terminal domain-containing protein [Thermodesulfobacteriota bacterium]|nr:ParB N-terminal domain-containing protein [Thermodesulfobacteriota bacterium]
MTETTQETTNISIDQFSEQYGNLRIINPKADKAMVHSLEKYGQLTPVVVTRTGTDEYELLDGFKRLRGGRALSFTHLRSLILELNKRAGKAVIMQLNWVGKTISSMEEALVLHSLCYEDKLSQVEIATLLGRHKSWVNRRIALIERLCDEAQNSIKLGLIPVSMGRDLARLPRGNQEPLLETIHKHHLTCRETRKIAASLLMRPKHEHASILASPWELLRPEEQEGIVQDKNLDPLVKELQRKLVTMERHCLGVACVLGSTVLSQFTEKEELLLINCCKQAMSSVERVLNDLQQTVTP